MTKAASEGAAAARAEAAAWVARLQSSERTRRDEEAFAHWLGGDPARQEAFDAVTAAWETAGALRAAPRRRPATTGRRIMFAAALTVAVAILAAGCWATPTRPATYVTGVGEARRLRLVDGSLLTLDTSTTVKVSFTRRARRIELVTGRAYAQVAKDPGRPFQVTALGRQVVARGTAFDVAAEGGAFTVVLSEGNVDVTGDDRVTMRLTPGQRLVASGRFVRVDQPDLARVTAWRAGRLVLDNDSLAAAVAQMNRYDDRKILLQDPVIGQLRVSGAYATGDTEAFATSIAVLFGLKVEGHRDRILIGRTE